MLIVSATERERATISEVGPHLARDIHTVVRRILAVGIDLRALQKRLCRDTAPVEAHTARLGLLNDGHRAAQLRGAYGGHITSRAASYNQNVVFHCFTIFLVSVKISYERLQRLNAVDEQNDHQHLYHDAEKSSERAQSRKEIQSEHASGF